MKKSSPEDISARIAELNKVAPSLTEAFGEPEPRTFNYIYTHCVWMVVSDKLVIEYVVEEACEFFALNVELEADFEYTGLWTLAKCPVNGDIDKFIATCKFLAEAIHETMATFPAFNVE